MSAYIVVEVEVNNADRYENYKRWSRHLSLPTAADSSFVGKVETLEGNWAPRRFVIVKFPSLEKAKAWWNSAEYADAKALRQATAKTQMIMVEGVG